MPSDKNETTNIKTWQSRGIEGGEGVRNNVKGSKRRNCRGRDTSRQDVSSSSKNDQALGGGLVYLDKVDKPQKSCRTIGIRETKDRNRRKILGGKD